MYRVGFCEVGQIPTLDVGVDSGHIDRSWRSDRFRKVVPRSERQKSKEIGFKAN